MSRKKNSYRKIIFILIIIAAVISVGTFIYTLTGPGRIMEIEEIPMSFAVKNIGGFNTGTDEIYFGSTPKGSSANRTIHIVSDYRRKVRAIALGNISQVVTISQNDFIVEPGVRVDVELMATAPKDVEYVTRYSGTLRLLFLSV